MSKPYPALCADCKHSEPEEGSAWALRCQHPKVNGNDPWALASARKARGTDCRGELRAEIKRLQDLLFAQGAMAEAPCFCCGYNGPGYFQVEAHPCAERHLLAMSEAG